MTELCTDGNLETLLATQKSGGGPPGAGGASAGANASASAAYPTANDGLLGPDGLEEGYDPAFAAVHNGNGTAEY
jgi:hypothetical protein